MKFLAGVLFSVFIGLMMVLVLVIQVLVQLMPLLIVAALAYGVVVAVKRHAGRAVPPPGYMLVAVPPPPPGPQLALPPPRRNPIDIEVFGPVAPGDSAWPDRWDWR